MKIVKTASGKKQIKISKSEWESIGKTAGWTAGWTAQEEEKDFVPTTTLTKESACMDHKCFECGFTWGDNQKAIRCPECKSSRVSNWFDED